MTHAQSPAGPAGLSPATPLGRFQRRRRIVLALLLVLIFGCLLFIRSESPPGSGLHELAEQIGAVLILVAILGRTWCTLYIGGRKSAEIVREGPYSVTRNPLYVFSAIGAAGVGAMSGSFVVAALLCIATAAAFHYVILVEERHLEGLFGEPYRRYLSEVPRFLPNPRLFVEAGELTIRPHFIYRTFSDGLVFALAYPFFEVVEHLQAGGHLPILMHLY